MSGDDIIGQALRAGGQTGKRFEKKRETILDAATVRINESGLKGTTLKEVASAVGLNTTSVTYYFGRKEQLAVAVFERTLERLHAMAKDAGKRPDPDARVEHFIYLHLNLRAEIIRGKAVPLANLSEMRAVDDTLRPPLEKRYQQILRDVRGFFGAPEGDHRRYVLTARAHILLELMFWLPRSISHRYPIDEFPRVKRRIMHLLRNGIGLPGAVWCPKMLSESPKGRQGDDGASHNFLRVATRLINERGYRGASVTKIVEELKVTKGSFYHHLDAKDDLILQCFRTSYRRIADIQLQSRDAGATEWERLSSAIASLLDIQFDATWPLTRTSALQALPPEFRDEVMARSDRTALRFSGCLIEGVLEGSLRFVDPIVASQVIIATLNAAFDLRKWASRMPREEAIAVYAATLVEGIFGTEMSDRDTRARSESC